ncbi:MAG: right-handed parallel beta-helix repeat-containing protein [Candidatus Eisenbacteria bacterium]
MSRHLRLLHRLALYATAIWFVGFSVRSARATVWEVDAADPPECGRIAAVLALTAPGDTIAIGPGEYFENLELPHGIALIGAGSEATILRPCEGTGSMMHAFLVGPVRIESIGFEDGQGSPLQPGGEFLRGGALHLSNGEPVVIENCRFENNDADDGGAISGPARLQVRDCLFRNNRGRIGAGSVEIAAAVDILIEGSVFSWDRFDAGSQVKVAQGSRVELRGCTFVADVDSPVGGPDLGARNNIVEDCIFWDVGTAAGASTLRIDPWTDGDPMYGRVSRSVFGAPAPLEEAGPGSLLRTDFLELDRLTVVNQGLRVNAVSSTLQNSIVVSGELNLFDPVGGTAPCNVFWDVDLTNSGFDLTSTRFVDPLLCDVSNMDLTVLPDSPCRPENSNGCGWIGALEGDCGVTPVLISGMTAERLGNQVLVSWEWTGVEPETRWAVVRRAAGSDQFVAEGQVQGLGREEVWDRSLGTGVPATYELRVQLGEGEWSALTSVQVEGGEEEEAPRLVLGPTVVANAVSLALPAGAEAKVVDVSGRVRATLPGAESGVVDWDLTDSYGERLESGVFWVSAGQRKARIVVLKRD